MLYMCIHTPAQIGTLILTHWHNHVTAHTYTHMDVCVCDSPHICMHSYDICMYLYAHVCVCSLYTSTYEHVHMYKQMTIHMKTHMLICSQLTTHVYCVYLPCAHSRGCSGCHGEDHNLCGRGPPPHILSEITSNVKGAFILLGTGVANQGVWCGP